MAISTNQKPPRNSCWCLRTISRKRRRTRLRTTATPMRREVTNPARDGPEFSTNATFNIRSLPRRVVPSRLTRAYSDRCVKRRSFRKENEPRGAICTVNSPTIDRLIPRRLRPVSPRETRSPGTKEVFLRKLGGRLPKKSNRVAYEPGDWAGVSAVPAGDSVVAAGASDSAGLVASVVAGAVVGAGVVAGVTVSVFCSHAARSAAPARIKMYFFIIKDAYCFN